MTAHCPSCGYNLKAETPVSVGPMSFDPRGEVRFHGQRLHLTPAERIILGTLLSQPGKFVSTEVLNIRIGTEAESRVVDTHVSRIRKRLRAIDPGADPIETRSGLRRWVERRT